MTRASEIAIVGAGFAGTLLAVQLAAQARVPLHIALYDAHAAFARGVAYSTREPWHLLNVRADKMGAFEDKPEDFYRWLLANESVWRSLHPELAELAFSPESFMPRMVFGKYIESLFNSALANKNGVTIEQLHAQVVDAQADSGKLILALANGSTRKADGLALALGNLLAGRHGFEEAVAGNIRYIGSLWTPARTSILTRDTFTEKDAPVVIIGSGLTMVDMLLSLRRRNYRGKIIAVSRHGLLPQPHDTSIPAYPRFLPPETAPQKALALFSRIRREIRQAQKAGIDWRGVVDSLRPDTQALWKGLPETEQKKLTRTLAYWSVHRHRMPVSSAEFIAREEAAGSLEIRSGSIREITEDGNDLSVKVSTPNGTETIQAAHVLNCAGPGMNIDRSGNPLLLKLRDRGILRKGPLGLGIGAEEDGRVKGNAKACLFALGPLLTGERFETIAVPEIRRQARVVAASLLKGLTPS